MVVQETKNMTKLIINVWGNEDDTYLVDTLNLLVQKRDLRAQFAGNLLGLWRRSIHLFNHRLCSQNFK